MKPNWTYCSNLRSLTVLFLLGVLSTSRSFAAAYDWTGASGTDDLWATTGNWNPSGVPDTADSVIFGDADPVGDAFTVNNIVGANKTIAALSYTNSLTGTWHVTEILSGVVLSTSGTVTIGGGGITGLNTSAAMAGGGTFLLSNALNIGNPGPGSGTPTPGTLDLSNLTNFVYNANGGTIGIAATGSRAMGTLILAGGSNTITAGTININGATGTASSPMMHLGSGTNIINVNTFNVGGGRSTTTLQFFNADGGLRLRGTGGTDADRSNMVVGNRNTGGTATKNTFGNVFLNGHPVDLKLATLTLGLMSRNSSGTDNGAYNPSGVFQFDQGTVDVTTINMGVCSGNSSNSTANGTLTVGATGTLLVGNISLANASSVAVNCSANGTLNISGGVVNCTGNITKTTVTGSTGIVAIATGALSVGGAMGIDRLDVTDATLTLRAAASAPATVTDVITGGGTNVINISSVPAIASYPAQFQVLKYSGTIGGAGFDNNIGLGTLPTVSPAYQGYLSNNTANLSLDLVITNGPAPAQPVVWTGTQSGAWDTSTLNWRAGATATNYNNAGDFVTFNDTASTSTVYLVTATLTPGSLTVSNQGLAYTFAGSGKLSGSTGLTKQGSGTLILNNSGGNDFSGGVSLTGTLQIGSGGTSGNLPSAVGVINNGTLVFNRSDNFTAANAISGTGAVTKNGANTLTLSGNNSFGGGLTANSGVLRLASTTAPGAGTLTVNSGGTAVLGAQHRNSNIVLAGGVLGSSASLNPLTNDLTAAAGTTSTIFFADPQNLAAIDGFEMAWINTLRGSGSILVATVTNDPAADAGNGFRLRGTNASDFSGTITFSNNVKGELQTAVAGPFSPGGTGKLRLVCGAFYGTNSLNGPTIGGYSEINLRNNSAGDTVLGNDVELLGAGISFLNPLGSAPEGSRLTMGNLNMGGGQELGVYLGAAPSHVIVFPTVTLTGGNATFSPKTPDFGATTSAGSDLSLGSINQLTASGITMNGLRTLFLTGTNTYSGTTTVSNGTLLVNGRNLGTGSVLVYGGTLGGTGVISAPVTIGVNGTLAPGVSIDTLTISNSLTLTGTNVMEVSPSGSDKVVGLTSVALGGTLNIVVVGQLSGGEVFRLFEAAAGGYSGDFTTYDLPPLDPPLAWDRTSVPVNGTLRVTGGVEPPQIGTAMRTSDGNFQITGTGPGTAAYRILATTNVALPLPSWVQVGSGNFIGGAFSFTDLNATNNPLRFYSVVTP